MPDLAYTDPRIAAIYDILNPPDKDTVFYLRLAGPAPQHVLDMGCGTGRLAFETRNPAVRAWEKWTPDQTTEQATIPEIGPITIYYDVQTVTDKLVTFNTHIHFANEEVVVAPSTLRFMDQTELVKHLQQAGFTQMQWFGNWDSSPLQSDSPEIIVIAS